MKEHEIWLMKHEKSKNSIFCENFTFFSIGTTLTNFSKRSILDIWQGSEYASDLKIERIFTLYPNVAEESTDTDFF